MSEDLRNPLLARILTAGWMNGADPTWREFRVSAHGIVLSRKGLPMECLEDKDVRMMTEQAAFQEAGLALFRSWNQEGGGEGGGTCGLLFGADGLPARP